jgi:hypothetical protein
VIEPTWKHGAGRLRRHYHIECALVVRNKGVVRAFAATKRVLNRVPACQTLLRRERLLTVLHCKMIYREMCARAHYSVT